MNRSRCRFAVTGGAGFIGSRLVAQLLLAGHECLVLDNLSVGLPAPEPRDHLTFVQRDICDVGAFAGDIANFAPDCVIHLAAIHHIPSCEKNAPEAFRVNIVGTQSVIEAVERAAVKRFILASSGAVYDWVDGPLSEDSSPLRSTDVYSLSKYTNEQQLALALDHGKFAAAIVARIFNTIGSNDPNGHVIPDIARQLKSGAKETVIALGNTTMRRDYVHVDDTAAGLFAMAVRPLEDGKHVFNIGTGVEHSVKDLVEEIASIQNTRCIIQFDPARVRKVDRLSLLANPSRAKAALGWQPKVPFAEAVRRAIQS